MQCDRIRKRFGLGDSLLLYNTNSELSKRGIGVSIKKGQETACSLLAPWLFPELKRILVLDCDLIVQRDLRDLYATPLDGAMIAGVLDYDFIGQYNGNSHHRRYFRKELGLAEPFCYFQGGVLLFNLDRFREKFSAESIFTPFCKKNYRYDEQDYLNKLCEGEKKLVDPRWNVMHDNDHYRDRYVIGLCPNELVGEYRRSRTDPWIIHFAGNDKPWRNPSCDYGSNFWSVAEKIHIITWPDRVTAKHFTILYRLKNELVFAIRHKRRIIN